MSGLSPLTLSVHYPESNNGTGCPADREVLLLMHTVNDAAKRLFEALADWWEENRQHYLQPPDWLIRLQGEVREIMNETRRDFFAFQEKANHDQYSITLKDRQDIRLKVEGLHFRLAEIQIEQVTAAREDRTSVEQMELERTRVKNQKPSPDDSCVIS